jgi:predicted acetyltransferase
LTLDIRPLTPADHGPEHYDLSVRAFGHQDEARFMANSEPFLADGRGLGAFDDGRLVGAALYHDMRQWWYGRPVPMAGVAGVKVAPECRGGGVGRALMTALTGLMTSRGYPLCTLYAATMPFYRKLGWELAGAHYEAVLPARSLLELARPAGTRDVQVRRPGPADAAEILDIIGRVHEQARDCGPVTFDEATMRRWLTGPDGRYAGSRNYAYLAPDGVAGYAWSGGGHEEIFVDRVLAMTPETTSALWSVIASHSSVASKIRARVGLRDPLWWLLREQDAQIGYRDPWMLRLLDAPAAIAARGFPAVDLAVPLQITDDLCPHNSGWWQLTVRAGKAQLIRTTRGSRPAESSPSTPGRPGDEPPLALGARGLAALYAGTPVATLRRTALATGGTPEADAALDAAFAATPYMLDDF